MDSATLRRIHLIKICGHLRNLWMVFSDSIAIQ